MTLSDLLEKLEEASEGSRELDALIWCALNGAVYLRSDPESTSPGNFFWFRHPADGLEYSCSGRLHFSTNLDHALTLVPELSELHFDWWRIQARATIYLAGEVAIDSETRPTPALAVVVAALKARQALSSTGDE